jgi:hypothetical protein
LAEGRERLFGANDEGNGIGGECKENIRSGKRVNSSSYSQQSNILYGGYGEDKYQ